MKNRIIKHWLGLLVLIVCVLTLTTGAQAVGIADIPKPTQAQAISYGTSGAGRSLMAYKFGSGTNVMVLGFAIHGFEDNWSRDGQAMVYTAGQLMQQLDKNTDLILDYDWTIYVLPCMNPDGLADGYSMNGPGRCTTTYLDKSGHLITSRGIDMNRSFPHRWVSYSSSRYFNGPAPLSSRESKALAQFIQDVKGSGTNICIDAHGWMSQIITSNGYSKLYSVFKAKFPYNTYAGLAGGNGYFASYAADLGYTSCLFEFPDGLYSMAQYQRSGYCGKFCDCILTLAKEYGSYSGHKLQIQATAESGGTVSGAGIYKAGATVTLTATPNSGQQFVGWYDKNGQQVSTSATYSFTPTDHVTLTARFGQLYVITATASRSGTVTGAGNYAKNDTVTLTAVPGAGKSVTGWYDQGGNKLATGTTYSFTAQSDRTVCAMFSGDRFIDIPANAWYLADAEEAASLGLVNGVNNITFDGSSTFTRAMAVVMISRIEGADTSKSPRAPFTDVPQNEWYTAAVNWAYENKVVNGISATQFAPNNPITRQEFAAMMIRYINGKGLSETVSTLPYSDQNTIGDWAVEYIKQAYAMRIILGDDTGKVRPLDNLPRSEGTVIILRVYKYLKSHGKL